MEEWNEADFSERMLVVSHEFAEEFNSTNSIRTEALLLTNYIEWQLKNILEYILESKSARNIARKTIAKILEEKQVITSEIHSDVKRIFLIRDLFSHNLSRTEIEIETGIHIGKMYVAKFLKGRTTDWDNRNVYDKLADIFEVMSQYLERDYKILVMEKAKARKS